MCAIDQAKRWQKIRPGRGKLNGIVEIDEAFIGAPGKGGKRCWGVQITNI